MIRPRWRKVWADLAGHKVRTLLVALSIAVGVFAVGTVGGSYVVLGRTFSAGYLAANPAHAQIFLSPFDDGLLPVVRRMPGVAQAEGQRTVGGLKVQTASGEWKTINLYAARDFRARQIEKLQPEAGAAEPGDRGLLVERTSLPLIGVPIGETVQVELADGRRRMLRLDGTVYNATQPPASFSGQVEAYVRMDALEWLGERQYYDTLNLTVAEDSLNKAHIEEVTRQVAARLERAGYTVFVSSVPEPGRHPAYQVIQSLLLLLGAIGGFSVFLSGFLVVNTLNALLAQQVRQIGMMKAIGARTGQLARLYLALVLGFGTLAFLLAAPLATVAAYALCVTFARLVNFDLTDFAMPSAIYGLQAAMSLIAPVLAALGPILNGTRLTVREAVANYGLGKGHFGRSWFDRRLEQARGLSRPVLISLRNAFRRKTRLALTLVTLTLAGALFSAVLNVRASLSLVLNDFLDSIISDINLALPAPQPIETVRALAMSLPEVEAVEGWLTVPAKLLNERDEPVANLILFGPPADSRMIRPILERGRWLLPGDQNAAVVGADYVSQNPGSGPGATLRLAYNGKPVTLTIVGVMRSLGVGASSGFLIYTPFDYVARLSGAGSATAEYRLLLKTDTPEAQARAAQALVQVFEQRKIKAFAQTGAEIKAQVSRQIEIVLLFLAPMALMVGAVGALGLTGTLSLNVLERTREIGVLRAIGASNSKVFQIVVVEGLVIGLLSWLLGALCALPVSALLAGALSAIFNLSLPALVAPEGLGLWLGVVLVLAWLASVLPAWNAVRLTVRDVLAYE